MVTRLVRAALTHRTVVFLLAGVLLAAGFEAARTAPVDVFPEFAPPIVEIQAESPGLAAEDVEALVTTPIERAIAGASHLDTLRSSSAPGLSVVTAVFPYGTDPYVARQLVTERLTLVTEQLPHGVRPQVAPLASALPTILAIGLRAGAGVPSPMELRDLAEWTVRPRLLAVPGVADVVIYGGQVRQLRVTTTPERLWAAGVTLDDLIAATTGADAAAGSGFLDRSGQRLLGWLDGRVRDSGEVARAVLATRDGVPVPVEAVADVAEGAAVAIGDAVIDGEPGVVLLVTKQPNVNVLEVTTGVERALAAMARALPAGVRLDRDLFRQASFVEHATANLRRALAVAALLVGLVLLLFLGDLRAVAVSLVAIPLSLLSAVLVLRAFGATLNVMVLGGFAIAVGEVVDDAIIDLENVWRRLRLAPPDTPADDVVLAASVEVRSAVVYATLMVALVFLPVVMLGGLEGALFRPLAVAYVLATMASLGVALTVTPALARSLLPRAAMRHARPPRLVVALRGAYERVLLRLLAHPRAVVGAAGVTALAGIALTPLLRLEFLPEFHETNFVMHMTAAPGTGLDESTRVGRAIGAALHAIPGVRSVTQLVGRSTLSEDTWGAERSELLVSLDDTAEPERVTRSLRDGTAGVTGFVFDVKQYLNERIEELLEGSGGTVVVRVHGADLGALEEAARALAGRLQGVPGAVDVQAESLLAAPGVRVQPRRDALLGAGLPATAIEQALRAELGGLPVARVVRHEQQADLAVALADDVTRDPQRLARLPLVARNGQVVPLGAVAWVDAVDVRGVVVHEDGVRTVRIRLDVRDRALAAVAADVERMVATTSLPPGVYAEVGGEYAAAEAARRRLLGFGGLAAAGIIVLLLIDFRSARLTGLTLINLPLAFVGGIGAIVLGAAGRLSLGAIVGFVTVFGLTLRNGIVLIAHFEQLRRERGAPLDDRSLASGAGDRLAPVLMTALVTGIALVPLILLGGHAGGEIEHPLAVVVVGGLVTSTLLNLLLVPTLYAWTVPLPVRPRGR